MMERILKGLFDYQKFEGNPTLQHVIDAVHAKYSTKELNMDDMGMVYAAGVPELPKKKKDGGK